MQKILFLMILPLMLVFFAFQECLAGAWTSKKGNMYGRIALNDYHADEEFDRSGDRRDFDDNGRFRDFNMNTYQELGLTDRATVITSFYYKYLKKDDDRFETDTHGVGDMDLGLKLKLVESPWGVLSTQGLVKVPEAYDEDSRLPLGNGQYDFELRILYGLSLWPRLPGYCNVEAGYRYRDGAPADEFRYLFEFGMDFGKKFYGRVKLDGILGLNNADDGDAAQGASGNPSATDEYDLGKLDMALGCRLGPSWGLEVGYVPEIYGENTSAGATVSLAVVFQLQLF